MGYSIRPYQPAHDADVAYALWQAALRAEWPLTRVYFDFITQQPAYRPGDHFVAEADGQVRGFLATHFNPLKPLGSILTLYVHPNSRRQRIGTALLRAGLDHLRAAGAQRVQLGGSTGHYFWPGVPLNLPGAVDFFHAAGWTFTETVHDLTGDLRAYQTPVAVHDRAAALGVTFRVATPADREAILAFEEREFPHWTTYYEEAFAVGQHEYVLAGWDGHNQVVAALLLGEASLDPPDSDSVWHTLLGADVGSIGAVGVAQHLHSQGIGLALVAQASELHQSRGLRQCLIGWTTLLDFYGKLGYRRWRDYAMSWLSFTDAPPH